MSLQNKSAHPTKSPAAYERLKKVLPGGVDGNAKFFNPLPVAKTAYGCRLVDLDDREYIDYCCGYGPLIFGHNDPDITTALAENMQKIAPVGNTFLGSDEVVYHSGTFNANPMAMTAVVVSLNKLVTSDCLQRMQANGDQIRQALGALMQQYGVAGTTTGMGPFLQWYFGVEGDIKRPEQLITADQELGRKFHRLLLDRGIFFMPGFRGYVSAAHQQEDIDRTIAVMEAVFQEL